MPPINYTPNNPWMNMDQLSKMMSSGDHDAASFNDPEGVQQYLNMQNAQAGPTPESQPAPASAPQGDWLDQMFPNSPQDKTVGGGGGGVPGPSLDRLHSISDQLRSMNLDGTNLTKDEIEKLKSYRDKMPTGSQGVDLTPLMALADSWGTDKSNFAGSYKRPETAQDREDKKAKVGEALAGLGDKLANTELSGLRDAQMGEIAGIRFGQEKANANSAKLDAADEKAASHFNDAVATAMKSGRFNAAGLAEKRLQSAQAVERIAQQYPDLNNMPPRTVHELSAAFNNLVSNGNPNVAMYEDIVPKSIQGKTADIENYFLNRPGGANQGEFIKNMLDSVGREKKLSQEQINTAYKDFTGGTAELGWAKRRPDQIKGIMRAQLNSARLNEPAYGEKVTVTNGKETLQIDPADVPHAVQDGYTVKK